MRKRKRRLQKPAKSDEVLPLSVDETDWLDWERWQAADDYQDLLESLDQADPIPDESIGKRSEFDSGGFRFAQRLHRQGFEVEE